MVVDGDYGANGRSRDGLDRLGLRYAVAILGNLTFWTAGARRSDTAAVLADAESPDKRRDVTWTSAR